MDELEFDEESHTYFIRGDAWPSVTQIIRDASDEESAYDSIPDHILKRAAEVGNKVHDAVEKYHAEGSALLTDDDRANSYLQGYSQFLMSDMFEWRSSEHRMFCDCHRYAGTVDLVGLVNAKPSILDVKTTSKLDEDYVGLQTVGYKHLWNANREFQVTDRWAVWLKQGDYELVHLDDPLDWPTFEQAVEGYYGAEN